MNNVMRDLWDRYVTPGSLSWLLWLCGLPFLATAPILNDGPEMVSVALSGGVLHPPGFPFQNIINQLAVHLPFQTASYGLSLVSYTAHCLTTCLFFMFLSRLALPWIWCFCLGATFFLGGPLIFLGTQPEVFALSHLCIMASFYLWYQNENETTDPLLGVKASLLIGISMAQHPITIVALPFWLALAHKCVAQQEKKPQALSFFLMPGAFVVCLLYGSLLLMQQDQWPTWGGLSSIADVLNHFLRLEYGSFDLQEDAVGESANTLFIMLTHNAIFGAGLYILLTGAFIFTLLRPQNIKNQVPYLGFIILCLVFAGIATSFGDPETSFCIAYRFTAIPWLMVLISTALLLSASGQAMINNKILLLLAAFQLGILFTHEVPNFLSMRDQTFTVFHRTLQDEVEPQNIYLSMSDMEAYLSSSRDISASQFPMDISFYEKSWYREDLQKRFPQHFSAQDYWPKTAGELLYEKWKNGTTLKATLEHLVAIPKSTPQLEGLLFVNRPSGKPALSPRQRLQKNIHLCNDLLLLNALPGSPFIENPDTLFRTRRFAFLHAFRFFYLRAFADAYEIAKAEKMPSDFLKQISGIIESFQDGSAPEIWHEQCRQLQETITF